MNKPILIFSMLLSITIFPLSAKAGNDDVFLLHKEYSPDRPESAEEVRRLQDIVRENGGKTTMHFGKYVTIVNVPRSALSRGGIRVGANGIIKIYTTAIHNPEELDSYDDNAVLGAQYWNSYYFKPPPQKPSKGPSDSTYNSSQLKLEISTDTDSYYPANYASFIEKLAKQIEQVGSVIASKPALKMPIEEVRKKTEYPVEITFWIENVSGETITIPPQSTLVEFRFIRDWQDAIMPGEELTDSREVTAEDTLTLSPEDTTILYYTWDKRKIDGSEIVSGHYRIECLWMGNEQNKVSTKISIRAQTGEFLNPTMGRCIPPPSPKVPREEVEEAERLWRERQRNRIR